MTPGAIHQVMQARQSFFSDKALPVDMVSHTILRSWIRCAERGLDAGKTPKIEPSSQVELRALHDRHETLRRLSRPELDALYGEARELSGIVILTNAQGEILDCLGDAQFANKAAQFSVRPGACWDEAGTGTNGVGTALAERRAVMVNGAEHYFQGHQVFSCVASPILDPRGQILGALDMSVSSQPNSLHMLGMVRLAVEQIEYRMFRLGFEDCHTLRFQTDPHLMGASREGILVLRNGVVVGANRRGLSLIGRGYEHLDQVHFEDIFAQAWQAQMGRGKLVTPDGREFHAEISVGGRSENGTLAAYPQAEVFTPTNSTGQSLEAVELALMRSTLEAHKGNVSAAARALGVHRSTLYRRLGISDQN